MKGKRYKVAFSIVLFQCYFNQHIVFNSFKINTFSLITYPLTLSYRKQTPQQMKISPASATGFWNELYFYRAKFIIMEWSLFVLYINTNNYIVIHMQHSFSNSNFVLKRSFLKCQAPLCSLLS